MDNKWSRPDNKWKSIRRNRRCAHRRIWQTLAPILFRPATGSVLRNVASHRRTLTHQPTWNLTVTWKLERGSWVPTWGGPLDFLLLPPSGGRGGEPTGGSWFSTRRRGLASTLTSASERSVRMPPPPSGEVRVPLYGRHRLFSELAGACHTHTHTCTSKGICPRMI